HPGDSRPGRPIWVRALKLEPHAPRQRRPNHPASINHPGEHQSEWSTCGRNGVMMFRSTNRSRGGDPRIRDLEAGSNTNSGPRLKEGKVAVQAASPFQAPVDNGDAYAAEDARGYGWVAF